MTSPQLLALLAACAPQVDPGTARALIAVESAANPHAIGVVGGALPRQPAHHTEAITTAKALQAQGWNFSVGLSQINVHNLARLGLTLDAAFEPCANLSAMQTILLDCYRRAVRQPTESATTDPQRALRQALSCYYSGNFTTGFQHGYVRKVVLTHARQSSTPNTHYAPKE
jgi:type IV secretion system protein VirB1